MEGKGNLYRRTHELKDIDHRKVKSAKRNKQSINKNPCEERGQARLSVSPFSFNNLVN